MRFVDTENLKNLPGRLIKNGDTFSFRCHSGISCFNLCCRNLNLFLYPYDVVRLKHCLNISSGKFLDRYVDVVMRKGNFFPDVLLRMSDNSEKTCPWLSASGCSVYVDRPDACRTFPVERGLYHGTGNDRASRVCYFRPPDFCMGQHEDRTWTAETWAVDQEAELFNKMTLQWSHVKGLFQRNPWGSEGPEGSKAKVAFMATYNIDSFRDFVFESSFLKRYKVKTALLKKIKYDDLDLLKFGFDWIKLFVWNIKTKNIRMR
ncbi:MAG: YkgJ family cysteine cluster protein [Deltaproteobacteria bacterium]|nr:YkgJ family cysteine cluster protein [Deltaproteobacteria bacterium]